MKKPEVFANNLSLNHVVERDAPPSLQGSHNLFNMADGSISFSVGLGIRALDSNYMHRKREFNAHASQISTFTSSGSLPNSLEPKNPSRSIFNSIDLFSHTPASIDRSNIIQKP